MSIQDQVIKMMMELNQVELTYPFDQDTMVFKVYGKMFAIIPKEQNFISLKNTITENEILRDMFFGIIPGYHLNKAHWNSIYFNQDVPEALIFEQIEISYWLVISKMTKKIQREIFDINN